MWRVQSFQSASAASAFDLNDASYYAYIEDSNRMQIMPTIKSVAITRGQFSPTIVGINREMDKTVVTIRIRAADWRTALKNLLAACPNDEAETGTLTVTDDDGAEWTIAARVSNLVRTKFEKTYELSLDVPDLIWRKIATVDTWNITASEQTTEINNTGNRKVRPVIKFKATNIKADGFLYRYWISVMNPNTDRGIATKGLELTDGGLDTRPWVKDPANYVQINNAGGITSSQTTIPYDTPTGDMPTYSMGYIDDGVNQEQICWTGRTGTTSGNLTGVTRGIGGTTPRAFADNVKIYLSYMQADGRDLRCYRNNLEQNLWVSAPNTAATRLWVVASEPAGIFLELGADIPAVGTITKIYLKTTTANHNALSLLPTSGVLRFNDEAFSFVDRDPIRFTVDIDARSINDTTAGAHAIDDVGYWVPNDYWLYSGNPFLSAQETDDTRKPILELATSDNVTRDYELFRDAAGLRSDSWTPDVVESSFSDVSKASQIYTGSHMDETVDPATVMGTLMRSIYYNGYWRFENGLVTWTIYEPTGIDQVVSWTYEKYRTGATFPAWVKLEKSKDGKIWEQVAVVTSPVSASSWGTPTTAGPYAVADGYFYLRVIMWGTQGAGQSGGVGYHSAFEVTALQYKTVNPLVPEIMARSGSSYEHKFEFINLTNDMYFKVQYTGQLGDEIEVDCEAKTFKTLSDGKQRRAAIFVPNTQADWMVIDPGNNTLEHIESGVIGLTATITHEDLLVE